MWTYKDLQKHFKVALLQAGENEVTFTLSLMLIMDTKGSDDLWLYYSESWVLGSYLVPNLPRSRLAVQHHHNDILWQEANHFCKWLMSHTLFIASTTAGQTGCGVYKLQYEEHTQRLQWTLWIAFNTVSPQLFVYYPFARLHGWMMDQQQQKQQWPTHCLHHRFLTLPLPNSRACLQVDGLRVAAHRLPIC